MSSSSYRVPAQRDLYSVPMPSLPLPPPVDTGYSGGSGGGRGGDIGSGVAALPLSYSNISPRPYYSTSPASSSTITSIPNRQMDSHGPPNFFSASASAPPPPPPPLSSPPLHDSQRPSFPPTSPPLNSQAYSSSDSGFVGSASGYRPTGGQGSGNYNHQEFHSKSPSESSRLNEDVYPVASTSSSYQSLLASSGSSSVSSATPSSQYRQARIDNFEPRRVNGVNGNQAPLQTQQLDSSGSRTGSGPDSTKPTPSGSISKRANPLEDLIRTENLYVEDLSRVIKRVAAAWSRTNFPPPVLDGMFRAVEGVYRINKTLLGKLNEIGPSPSSPKALGDLLMRWITDLEPAYARFAAAFHTDFNSYEPVQSNEKLGPILDSLPWPDTLSEPSRPDQVLTMDDLFRLPIERLQYYQKLYIKLLKSTQEGRSDHALLVRANDRLDGLLASCEVAQERTLLLESIARSPTTVTTGFPASIAAPLSALTIAKALPSPRDQQTQDGQEILTRGADVKRDSTVKGRNGLPPRSSSSQVPPFDTHSPDARSPAERAVGGNFVGVHNGEPPRSSGGSSGFESPSGSDRFSSVTGTSSSTSATLSSGPTKVEDIERRFNTERALDIFTMLPKKCKLQMAPPNLSFSRQIRRSADVGISFYPSSDPQHRQIVLQRAYMVLLTDLFLICERMTPDERASSGGADMWLAYPPLAGKHLRVVNGQAEGTLEVTIMRKETLLIQTESVETAEEWKQAFEETIAFGANQGLTLSTDLPRNVSPLSPLTPGTPGSANSFYGAISPALPPIPRDPSPAPSQSYGANHASKVRIPPLITHVAPPPRKQSMSRLKAAAESPVENQAHLSTYSTNSSINSGSYKLEDNQTPSPGDYGSPYGPPPVGYSSFHPGDVISSQSGGSGYTQTPNSNGEYPVQNGYGYGAPSQHMQSMPGQYGNQMHSHLSPASLSGNIPQHGQQGGEPAYGSQRLRRSGSTRSNGSLSSALSSARTDRSSGYPDPPGPPLPPLPGKGYFPNGRTYDPRRNVSGSASGSLLSPGLPPGRGYPSSETGVSPGSIHRSRSADALRDQHYPTPSSQSMRQGRSAPSSPYGLDLRSASQDAGLIEGDSPPPSPVPKTPNVTSIIAQMRCKVFLQQNHGQWKSLGTAKLKLYLTKPGMKKQLVVESDKSDKKVLVSTMVLTDGVERVAKTGVAIELSDKDQRTGIIYMLQMKTEQAAVGLFDQLLVGSDRRQ